MKRVMGIVAGAVLGLVVLGGAALWLLHERTVPPAAVALTVPRLSSSVPIAVSRPGTAVAPSAAPWNLPALAGSSTTIPSEHVASAPPTLAQIQSHLQAIGASKQPNIAELDGALQDLEKNRGSSVIGNVDIAALRDTLARASRIQVIADEIRTLSSGVAGPDVAVQLQAKISEIQQLQSGMRTVTVPVPTPVVR